MVEVTCCHLPQSDALLLEVRDNGCGMARSAAGQSAGKGLENLHRRARKLGGQLHISTKAQQGTAVRLTVPLHEQ